MARVTGPLMSLDASGTVGGTTVFSKWKGQNYVRLRVTPQNNQTDAQQDARVKLGAVGHELRFVLRPNPLTSDRGSIFYEAAVFQAPAGQSWISSAVRAMIGSGGSNFTDKVAAYAGFGSGTKTEYERAATAIGITDFSIAVPGTIASVAGGALTYLLAAYANDVLHLDNMPADLTSLSTNDLDDFIDAVTIPAV